MLYAYWLPGHPTKGPTSVPGVGGCTTVSVVDALLLQNAPEVFCAVIT